MPLALHAVIEEGEIVVPSPIRNLAHPGNKADAHQPGRHSNEDLSNLLAEATLAQLDGTENRAAAQNIRRVQTALDRPHGVQVLRRVLDLEQMDLALS